MQWKLHILSLTLLCSHLSYCSEKEPDKPKMASPTATRVAVVSFLKTTVKDADQQRASQDGIAALEELRKKTIASPSPEEQLKQSSQEKEKDKSAKS